MANKLVDYMKNVHRLERDIYTFQCAQDQIHRETEKHIQSLEMIKRSIIVKKEETIRWHKPTLQKAPEVSKRYVEAPREFSYSYYFSGVREKFSFWLGLYIIGFIIFIISFSIAMGGIDEVIELFYEDAFSEDGAEYMIIFDSIVLFLAAILFCIPIWLPYNLIVAAVARSNGKNAAIEAYNSACIKAELDYRNAIAEQRRLNEQYEEKYDEECKIHLGKIRKFDEEIRACDAKIAQRRADEEINIKEIETQKAEVRKVLKDIYSVGIIYPKYRALIPISMFIEYFESGRCETLKGHEGAYNIYESEVRQDTIISSLANISSEIGHLRERQYMLYSAIKEANRISSDMARYALDSANSSRRTAENAERTAQNAALAAQHTKAIADSTHRIAQIEADRLDELKRLIED